MIIDLHMQPAHTVSNESDPCGIRHASGNKHQCRHPLSATPPNVSLLVVMRSRSRSGVHSLGLYCYQHDSIYVTLSGVSLVEQEHCQPKQHDGIVFNIVPIYLAEGFYEFEYTLRTENPTTYMMAAVLPGSVPRQPQGLISYAHGTLYLPAAVNPLIGDTKQYSGSVALNEHVRVVDLPPGVNAPLGIAAA
jgi:hypothetical protein